MSHVRASELNLKWGEIWCNLFRIMCRLDICPSMSHWLSQFFSPPRHLLLCTAAVFFFFTAWKTCTHTVNVEKTHEKALQVWVLKEVILKRRPQRISAKSTHSQQLLLYLFSHYVFTTYRFGAFLFHFHGLKKHTLQANLWPRNTTRLHRYEIATVDQFWGLTIKL